MIKFRVAAALFMGLTWVLPSGVAVAEELPRATPAEVGMSADKLAAIGDAIEGLIAEKKIVGGLVAVARHGKVCYVTTHGLRDTEPESPMTEDTIFRIYSMSKPITSAAVLILVDEGKVGLDDPVTKYVPEFESLKVQMDDGLVPLTRPVTIADLMRHTAGFSYGMGDDEIDQMYHEHKPLSADSMDEFAERLARIPLRYQPGDEWVYSVSIDVLGLVIERASGRPFDVFLKERIFEPLDMKDTAFYCPAEKADRFAALYSFADGEMSRAGKDDWGGGYNQPPLFPSGGGGLVSTARDYLHFMMMVRNGGELFGQRILKEDTAALMTTDQLPEAAFPIGFGDNIQEGVGFGYGFSVRVAVNSEDPHRAVGDYTWSGAASTHSWADPNEDVIVVTLEQRRPFTIETGKMVRPLVLDAVIRPDSD